METDSFGSSAVYKYHVNSKKSPRGVALIINNVKFEGEDSADRGSSNRDAENLKTTFEHFRYNVVIHSNLKAAEMKNMLGAVAMASVHDDHDSFICCILSHGNPHGIEGTDGNTVTVTELANSINTKNCSKLHGKPKMFFFQACRGSDVPEPTVADISSMPWPMEGGEVMVTDSRSKALPPEADFLFGFSTCEGNIAARGVYTGSQYIKSLCEAIKSPASSKLSIDDQLLVVNKAVAEKSVEIIIKGTNHKYHQMPEIRSTLRGKFYFKK